MFSNFDDVVANGQFVENAPDIGGLYNRPDLPPVQPTAKVSQQQPPKIPEWGKTLGDRVGSLEQKVGSLEQTVVTLEKKVDAGFAELKQLIQQR